MGTAGHPRLARPALIARSRGRRGRRGRPHTPAMLTLAGAALVLGACAPGPSSTAATGLAPAARPLAGLDGYIGRAVEEWGIAGLSVAVVKDDEVVFARGYGVRDVRTDEPVDEHTLFAIGSNTKLFTAVAAGIMADEGRLGWDDRAVDHLPGFRLHDPYVTREITIRDLLSHRSGLGRRGDMMWYGSELDRAEVLRRIRHLEPNSSFRSAYGYQNVMFLAAGEATAAAAGTTWDELVVQRLFRPLGMRRSNTSTHDLGGEPNVATPHIRDDGSLVPVPWRNLDNVAPAGSINSSAREMAEWLRMLLADGVHRQDTVISAAALGEILTPHTLIPSQPDTLFPSVHFLAYGLGIVAQDYRGRELFWHTGGIDGMLSLVAFVPEERLGIVVLTNTSGGNNVYTALMYDVVDRYLGDATRDWSRTLLRRSQEAAERMAAARQREEESRVAGTRPSLEPEAYAGSYAHPMYGEATVRLEDGRLVLHRGPAFTGDLEHWHYDTFRADWRDAGVGTALVTFTLDVRGRVEAIEVEGLATFRRTRGGMPAGR